MDKAAQAQRHLKAAARYDAMAKLATELRKNGEAAQHRENARYARMRADALQREAAAQAKQ